jgi:ketosteroid isomerase-like protein
MTDNPSPQLRTVLAWIDASDRVDVDGALKLVTDTFVYEIIVPRAPNHRFDKEQYRKHQQDHISKHHTESKTTILEVVESPGKVFVESVSTGGAQHAEKEHHNNITFTLIGDKINAVKILTDTSHHKHFHIDKRGQ